MDKNTVMTIVLVVLILVSVVQAFQLTAIKKDLADSSLSKSSSKVSSQSGGGSSSGALPASLDQIPQMVGGC